MKQSVNQSIGDSVSDSVSHQSVNQSVIITQMCSHSRLQPSRPRTCGQETRTWCPNTGPRTWPSRSRTFLFFNVSHPEAFSGK